MRKNDPPGTHWTYVLFQFWKDLNMYSKFEHMFFLIWIFAVHLLYLWKIFLSEKMNIENMPWTRVQKIPKCKHMFIFNAYTFKTSQIMLMACEAFPVKKLSYIWKGSMNFTSYLKWIFSLELLSYFFFLWKKLISKNLKCNDQEK